MTANLLCVAAMVVAVQFEAQPLKDGGFEYVVSVEPLALESLKRGTDLRSDVPLDKRDVRRIRITLLGSGALAGNLGPSLMEPQNSAFSPGMPGKKPHEPPFPGIGTAPPEHFTMPKLKVGKPADPKAATPGLPTKNEKPAGPSPSPGDRKPEPPPKAKMDEGAAKSGKQSPEPAAEERPLAPATLRMTLLAATSVGSFSGMVFFGWVAWDYRNRYRALLRRNGLAPTSDQAESYEDTDSEQLDPPLPDEEDVV